MSKCPLPVAGLLAILMLLGAGVAPAGEEPARPDILLIMPDQMRGDCLSILGHPAVRTLSPDLRRCGV